MDRLLRRRGALRAAATRLISSATEALQAEHPSLTDLEVILDDLQDKNSMLAALDEKIADFIGYSDDYEEEALQYHEKIRDTASRARYVLSSSARPRDCTHRLFTDTGTQGASTQASSRTPLRVALPKLQACVFSGKICEWQGCWQHSEAMIHNNYELSDIEKFTYLKSFLNGPAKRAIEGARLEQENYAVAVKLLQGRFGQHTALVNEDIDSLLTIAPVDRFYELSQLRELYEELRFRTSCLDSLGVLVADEQRIGDPPIEIIRDLIGTDKYWRIVTGRIQRLSNELCAVETIFGWVVQGVYQVKPSQDRNFSPIIHCSTPAAPSSEYVSTPSTQQQQPTDDLTRKRKHARNKRKGQEDNVQPTIVEHTK
ncbi:hypothetical protein HPB50_008785 [Hyalomma asiaticum]|uniref:Uncharacterized protein n=1 Tax=Hyalomma asiaticum TaxID=266040 RepID=A0ACB7TF99_HYAAI|nr:hypothetical protein HPB50_008785 [Hyalomma asiaticum]